MKRRFLRLSLYLTFLIISNISTANVVPVGSGSYTLQFPGRDVANRNNVPPHTANVTGPAATRPIPTNEWWSNFLIHNHGGHTFNYPLSFRSVADGLVVNYTWPLGGGSPNEFRQPMGDVNAIVVGVQGLNASRGAVYDYSDWTVTLNWAEGTRMFNATIGMSMPFVYFTKGSTDLARVTVNYNASSVAVSGNRILITNNMNGSAYAVFAPAGSTWDRNGNIFTSTLNGRNYWSMAVLPEGVDPNTAANQIAQHAYVFPANTQVSWVYNQSTSTMRSTYTITPDVKEGSTTTVLQGLLPHHWNNLAPDSPIPGGLRYRTVRGEMRILNQNQFMLEHRFRGILPNLPDLGRYSDRYDLIDLYRNVDMMKGEGLNPWTDSYNEGQSMNRLIQVARIADQLGNIEARDLLLNTVRERLEDWLSYESGEVAFLFYYHAPWTAILGYPAGHGQDSNLNDHHFHWGYFIKAASAIEQFFPGWANQWGPMINILIRDAASQDRNDPLFPFLRSFSPFAGHAWANGFATFPFGNDQESSSESMQFNSSLIHWGSATGNNQVRDLGIFLYVTEQSAIEEYWFDIHRRNFQPSYAHEMVARIWGAGYDNGTFWTPDIAAAYGIQLYPIHGGSLYLGHHPEYVQRVWTGMTQKTGILNNVQNPNLWHDIYWKFLSFANSSLALDLYYGFQERNLKFGISDAHTYHWLHNMNSLGRVRNEITANYPIATVFERNGLNTYVAFNYGNSPLVVNFSDGFSLSVPARSMATSRDSNLEIGLTASATHIADQGGVVITAQLQGGIADTVFLYLGSNLVGTLTQAPYQFTINQLSSGVARFYAKAVSGSMSATSNIVTVEVGSQQPFNNVIRTIPGIIEAGHYDFFEGSIGQGISYFDVSLANQAGTFRSPESVDAGIHTTEGATVGWVEAGEWLEYTVQVLQAGTYNMSFRYASGASTGGPFTISVNGVIVSNGRTVAGTGGWNNWRTETLEGIVLQAGVQIIRVSFVNGGFNLGRMTFELAGSGQNPLPTAHAGNDQVIGLPQNSVSLDGRASTGVGILFNWTQVSGPSIATILGNDAAQSQAVNLVEGTYVFLLTVTDQIGVRATDLVSVLVRSANVEHGGACVGEDPSGDFGWRMAYQNGQATVTFIPRRTGIGSTTLLFYPTFDPNATPGAHRITPNTPHAYAASIQATVYFYFTYSHPQGGERNSLANRAVAVLLNCATIPTQAHDGVKSPTEVVVYPMPVGDVIHLEAKGDDDFRMIRLLGMDGRVIIQAPYIRGEVNKIDVSAINPGMYIIELRGITNVIQSKVIKQ